MELYLRRVLDALEGIHAEMERLRILKEHEFGVQVELSEGGDPYVLRDTAADD